MEPDMERSVDFPSGGELNRCLLIMESRHVLI
jgi:hypothetical protein